MARAPVCGCLSFPGCVLTFQLRWALCPPVLPGSEPSCAARLQPPCRARTGLPSEPGPAAAPSPRGRSPTASAWFWLLSGAVGQSSLCPEVAAVTCARVGPIRAPGSKLSGRQGGGRWIRGRSGRGLGQEGPAWLRTGLFRDLPESLQVSLLPNTVTRFCSCFGVGLV